MAGGVNLIHRVFADMFILTHAIVAEQAIIIVRQWTDDFKERARDQDLVGLGKTHDSLRDIDAVAERVQVAVDVPHQFHRPQVNTEPDVGQR